MSEIKVDIGDSIKILVFLLILVCMETCSQTYSMKKEVNEIKEYIITKE